MRYLILCFFTILIFSCQKSEQKKLSLGTYRGILEVQDQEILPFIFSVDSDSLITIYNAEERIKVDEISYANDSLIIQTPVFEGYIKVKIDKDTLKGSFIKPSLDRIVPFIGYKNTNRFFKKNDASLNITGSWETVFSQNTDSSYIAKGIFNQKGNTVTGTFRTTTGDYRFLEGAINKDTLLLSTFDGAHAFLFKAKVTDSTMNGFFYSGNHWKESFTAKLNNEYELPEEEELTYLKEGYTNFSFAFPDTRGRLVSSADSEFQNKAVIVQVMGTWCPNCLDESKYLVNYLKANPNKNLKVVALAFEIAKDRTTAYQRINRLKDRIGIEYPVLLAEFGNEANKEVAAKKLPMLNHVISYPTTIFIDKNKKVRKIHTGFNGPATGKKYEDFTLEFESFVDKLLNEK